ncbi:MAG: outer membrane protein [Vicinamibacterales bacterium]
MRGYTALICSFAAVVLALPPVAAADTFFTPYIGSTFAAKYGIAEPASKLVYGGDLMWLGTSGLGFELDFAYHPNFFEPGDDEELFDFDSDGNVVTFMGNLVFGRAGGGIQPYVVGGFGLMRTNIGEVTGLFDDISDTAWGVNAGGGLRMGSPSVGLRGDLRYFRQLSDIAIGDVDFDLGDFSYWRGTVGVSFGF